MTKSWWKRFDCYSFWDTMEYDEHQLPLISASIDAWLLTTRPFAYYASNDTDRWESLHIRVYISRRIFAISIPYKKLPDYVPEGRAMLRTRRIQAEHEAKRAAQKV